MNQIQFSRTKSYTRGSHRTVIQRNEPNATNWKAILQLQECSLAALWGQITASERRQNTDGRWPGSVADCLATERQPANDTGNFRRFPFRRRACDAYTTGSDVGVSSKGSCYSAAASQAAKRCASITRHGYNRRRSLRDDRRPCYNRLDDVTSSRSRDTRKSFLGDEGASGDAGDCGVRSHLSAVRRRRVSTRSCLYRSEVERGRGSTDVEWGGSAELDAYSLSC